MVSLGRWRPKHLLLSWIAYWGALAFVVFAPALGAVQRAMNAPPDAAGVTAGLGSDGLQLAITLFGQPLWTLSTTLTALTLWIALPPLALWVLWLALASRNKSNVAMAPAEVSHNELPPPGAEPLDAQRAKAPARIPSPIP